MRLWYQTLINLIKNNLSVAKRPKLVWGSLILLCGLLYLKVWLPITKIGIPCVFHQTTGLYCPGCGLTRAVLSLLELNVHQAFRYNPLVFVLLPLAVAYVLVYKKGMLRTSYSIMTVMIIVTVAFGVLRNLPAFHWLAPIEIDS